MKWFLVRQDADGSRVDVAEYDSQGAAHEALASYEYHYPQYAPYFVEGRELARATPGPTFIAPPLPAEVQGPQFQELPQPTPAAPATKSPRSALLAVAAALLVGVVAITFFLFNRSNGGDIASDATPIPSEIDRVTPGTEPASPPPVPPTAEPEVESLAPQSTPTPEEVTLTQGEGTLEAVFSRGELNCGVSGRIAPFSVLQPDGSIAGFDADMCRAVAAAILGDSEAVNFIPLTAAERFTALHTGDVDVLMRNSTWTQSRDTDVGVDFGPTTYFDGQQLMARAGDGFTAESQLSDIEGAIVCTLAGTTTELNILAAVQEAEIDIDLFTFDDFNSVTDAFSSGECDVITIDGSSLVGRKLDEQPSDQEWVIFPRVPLSKEPLGPIYRQDDSRFADVVNWTVFAMLIADENGINQANVNEVQPSPPNGELGRLLGGPGELQSLMGLAPDAFLQAISQVGSYSDVYNRHLAPVGLRLEGSLNDLWINGGLMYPPPGR